MTNHNSEKWLEKKLTACVKECGGVSLKISASTVNGLPDRLILWPGGSVEFVELKSSGKKPEPHQKAVHKALAAAGYKVAVIDSEDNLKQWQSSTPGPIRPK